jgi:hypothetical protein
MIAMRNWLMPASRAVDVTWIVATAIVRRRTLVRVFRTDLELVFVDMIAMHMV